MRIVVKKYEGVNVISTQGEHKITKDDDSQSKAVKEYEERQETIKNAFKKYFELLAENSEYDVALIESITGYFIWSKKNQNYR